MTPDEQLPHSSTTVTNKNNQTMAVIWDMDGVLVDTGGFHFQVWRDVLARYGIELTEARFRQTFGMNNDGFLHLFLEDRYTEELATQISNQKEQQLRRTIRGLIKPMPGALSLLDALSLMGTPQALASSAPLANIKAILAEMAIENSFQAAISAEDMPGKPDPAVFLEAARILDMAPDQCIVIEDALPGVQAAKSAGMRCLAVTTTNSVEALSSADRVVEGLEAITADELLLI